MAPTITSNSFLLTTTPRSRFNLHNPKLIVLAKRAGLLSAFRLGKRQDPSTTEESQPKDSNNKFFFNIGSISDVKSLIPVVSRPSSGLSFGRRKDPGTVFVAGATGQAGIRIAQTLLREGFTVRAGVPDLSAAQELARLAAAYKIISPEESRRLNAVESTFEDAESIAKAIGNASKVVVTIGPTENGPTSEVTTNDALQVLQASQLAGVGHVAIVCDDRTLAAQSTYNVLDGISTFFTNLFGKSQPLTVAQLLSKVVESTDVKYTMIKTSLTDDFSPESAYNVVVSSERSAGARAADYKVVQVSTDPSAPSKSIYELFRAIPEDGRRKAYEEALAKARAEEEALTASEKAQEAAEAAKKLEEEVKRPSEQEAQAASLAQDAQKKADAAGVAMEDLLSKAQDFGAGLSWEKLSSRISTAVQKPEEKPKVQIATVRGVAKAKTLPAKKAVVKAPNFIPKKEVKSKQEPKTAPEKEVRKVFGGLFKQEIMYVDDD